MKRMIDWLLQKQLERNRRRAIRALLLSYQKVMETSMVEGGVRKCH